MSDGEFEDQFVQQKPSLIIFHGPPCSGKTRFYKENYEKTHARFSLEEWLVKGSEATLHGGIRRLAAKLKNGDSVVLDDCNPSAKSRESLLAAIKKIVPEFELEGVEFRPKGGLTQCRVAAEFAAAEEAEQSEKDRLFLPFGIESDGEDESSEESNESGDDKGDKEPKKKTRGLEALLSSESTQLDRKRQVMLTEWEEIANGLTYPEGFKLIQYIDQDLYCDATDLNTPTLLIDAQVLFSFKLQAPDAFLFDLKVVDHAGAIIQDWKQSQPKGQVIVLIDDATVLPSLVHAEADSPETQSLMIRSCHTQMLDALAQLQCKIPIYYYHIHFGAFDDKSFQRLSALGPVSWLLFRHHINPFQSLWVAPCPKNTPYPVPLGIPYISGTEFFASAGWDMASKLRQFCLPSTTLLPWMATILPAATGKDNVVDLDADDVDPKRVQPLEAERRTLLQKDDSEELASKWNLVNEEIAFGRTHGCAFPPASVTTKKRKVVEKDEEVTFEEAGSNKKAKARASSSQLSMIGEPGSVVVVDLSSQEEESGGVVVLDS